jgi:predicted RNase H-like nuclease (RuvC/YqgF family)
MRKILISALLIGASIASVPASAQRYDGYGDRGWGHRSDDRIDQQIRQLEQRIRQAAQNGRISRGEANRLLRQVDRLDRLEDRYSRNGLDRRELQELRSRVQDLRQQLRFERQDGPRDRW